MIDFILPNRPETWRSPRVTPPSRATTVHASIENLLADSFAQTPARPMTLGEVQAHIRAIHAAERGRWQARAGR